MTTETATPPILQNRGEMLQTSFAAIKHNTLNLNLLMAHIGLLTATVHELVNDKYSTLDDDLR